MHTVDVTPEVWDHLLEVRRGHGHPDGQWSGGEHQAVALYGPLATRTDNPMVVGQIGQSLDGRVATVSGDARDVSSPDGLAHLHRMRALVDAVIIGVRTAIHDSPQLTVRLCEGPNPARVVIDPRGRLGNDASVFRDDGVRRVVIQVADVPRPAGVEVIALAAHQGTVRPLDIVTALGELGLTSLLVEGGSFTLSRFIEASLLDRLHIAVAPVIIGDGPQGLTMPTPVERLSDALRPDTRAFGIGGEVVFDCLFNH